MVSGCQEDKGTGDYSTVSELIADRNKSRYAKKTGVPPKPTVRPKKETTDQTKPLASISDTKKEELSSIILYEETVRIVGEDSGRTLANGVAYINKQGQIVRIKIVKE